MAVIIGILSYLFLLASSVSCLTDPSLPRIFLPFGTDVGDNIVPVGDDVSSPGMQNTGGFRLLTLSSTSVYVSRC